MACSKYWLTRSRVLGAALLVTGLAMSQNAAAQTTDGNDAKVADGSAVKLHTVEVTGSRIKRPEGDSPVLTLTSADLQKSGIASLGDILQQLSVSGSALNTKFNSAGNFGFPADGGGVGSGSTTISLRSLGARRVLVLVDGLRWVNESSASGVSAAVDLNTIPASVIDRVEILTDGASSLYGSDAIGGVVNIITKKTQDGGLAHVYFGDFETGNGNTYTGNISIGGKTDRGEYFIDLSHYQQREISSNEIAQSRFPIPGTGVAFGSSATPTGRFVFFPQNNNTNGGLCPQVDTDGNGTPDTARCNVTPNGTANPQNFPGNFHQFTSADRFNFAPFNLLMTPSRRTGLFAQTRFDITDNIRWNIKGLYQARNSVNQAAPEPIFLGPGAGTGGLADTVGVDASNPFNPLGYSLDPNSNFVFLGRRPLEGGPRVFRQKVDTSYLSTGLSGDFKAFERLLSWDVNYASSVNSASQTINGTYNIRSIATALGPIANCVAPCTPLNIFGGPGTITPDQLRYIQFVEKDDSRQSLELFTVNLSGSLFQLPAGALDFATGFERRKLAGSYTPDSVVVAGDSNGVPSLATSGEFKVNEVYVELGVPVVADLPFFTKFDLSLASRYSDYSTFGSTIKSKFGARWQPFDKQLILRGNFAQGFRAPSVGEAFGSPARFDATITDPCSNATNPQTISNCQALGVAAPASFEQANTQIAVRTGGNRSLQPETAISTTLGLIYTPEWAAKTRYSNRVDFELTYYDHQINNAIQAPDAQTQLNRCVASGDPNSAFCTGITRGTSGDINNFNNTLRNLGSINTKGYDFGIRWDSPRLPFGRLGANWQTTYVQSFKSIANDTGLAEPRAVGVEVANSGIPRWRSTFRLNWKLNDYSVSYALRYISSLTEQCGDAAGFAVCGNPTAGTNTFGSVFYNDVQASWTLPTVAKASISAGVNNLLNRDPPTCLSCSLNGYDASVYDTPGRFAYVEATLRF